MSLAVQPARADVSEIAAYSAAQAARYAGVPERTVLAWLEQGIIVAPEPRTLCFKNLIECYVLRALRVQHAVRMTRVKSAVSELRQKWQSGYPLAEFELSTDDQHVFFVQGSRIYNLSRHGQQVFDEMLKPYLARIERDPDSHAPLRFHPVFGTACRSALAKAPRYVTIDPRVCFGRPVIAGTRISTEVVAGRRRAGEPISALAAEYGRSTKEITEAIRFEASQRAA